MKDFNAQEVFSGTFGELWIDDEYLASLKKFNAKVDLSYSDIVKPRDLWKNYKLTEMEGSGEIVIQSFKSTGKNIMAKKLKEGKMPVCKLVGKLDDPDARGAERIVIKDVVFTTLTLLDFEHGNIVEETLPFKFSDFEPIDLVE